MFRTASLFFRVFAVTLIVFGAIGFIRYYVFHFVPDEHMAESIVLINKELATLDSPDVILTNDLQEGGVDELGVLWNSMLRGERPASLWFKVLQEDRDFIVCVEMRDTDDNSFEYFESSDYLKSNVLVVVHNYRKVAELANDSISYEFGRRDVYDTDLTSFYLEFFGTQFR